MLVVFFFTGSLVRERDTMRNWFKDVSTNERDGSVFVGKSLVDYKTEIVSSKTVARETGGWGL